MCTHPCSGGTSAKELGLWQKNIFVWSLSRKQGPERNLKEAWWLQNLQDGSFLLQLTSQYLHFPVSSAGFHVVFEKSWVKKRWHPWYGVPNVGPCRIATLWKIWYRHLKYCKRLFCWIFQSWLWYVFSMILNCRCDFSYTDLWKKLKFVVMPHICQNQQYRVEIMVLLI